MDFTSTFKANTRAGRTLGRKPVLSSQKTAPKKKLATPEDGTIPNDQSDQVNKDFEDSNVVKIENEELDAEAIEKLIPRNL